MEEKKNLLKANKRKRRKESGPKGFKIGRIKKKPQSEDRNSLGVLKAVNRNWNKKTSGSAKKKTAERWCRWETGNNVF